MTRTIATLAMLFTLGLAGCAGQRTIYLALSPTSGPRFHTRGAAIAVAHVLMPPTIDRIYLTTATGPNTRDVSRRARWTAPLAGQAQAILARDLARRLPERRVAMPGDPVPRAALLVHVEVTDFMPHPGHVVLAADWRGVRAGKAVAAGRVRLVERCGTKPAAEAHAMSVALGRLADRIAARLSR